MACADPSHELRGLLQRRYGPRVNLAITLRNDITSAVAHLFREKLSHDASYRLDERAPEYSARVVVTRRQQIVAAIFVAAVAAGSIAGPALTAALLFLMLSLCYAANIALRAVLFAASGFDAGYRVSEAQLAALSDDTLPVYTILAPMCDEANMVSKLVAAIKKIDYPAAALDVKIVLEEEDAKTIEAAKNSNSTAASKFSSCRRRRCRPNREPAIMRCVSRAASISSSTTPRMSRNPIN